MCKPWFEPGISWLKPPMTTTDPFCINLEYRIHPSNLNNLNIWSVKWISSKRLNHRLLNSSKSWSLEKLRLRSLKLVGWIYSAKFILGWFNWKSIGSSSQDISDSSPGLDIFPPFGNLQITFIFSLVCIKYFLLNKLLWGYLCLHIL